MDSTGSCERRRVRVWLGSYVIADYIADAALADRYADAMRRRFAGLKVTSDALPPAVSETAQRAPRPLPSERLWELTP